ncbi:zinc-binding oxidoreductase alcohol dehydrogenase [Scheffersomyces amazonensis]|uniref:zinc-binding oxidoreductase alcohol dehydrogenase n=1 Tax=Scheffersomyces amazonensis TaxID=1078765 RepID=UPI00315D6C3E
MSTNKIAVSTAEIGSFTTVSNGPFPVYNDDQILIKGIAYAANPTDWKHIANKWGAPGSIAGSDASGIVYEVGKDVKGFEVGDFVSTTLHGNYRKDRGGFAEYVIADPATTVKYDKSKFLTEPLPVGKTPSSLINTFEGAAAITLSLATVGLSYSHSLKITPDLKGNSEKYILIWGGATATAILGIQVAKLIYGLKVITTASKKHHEFLKSLGADITLDYRDSDVLEQIKKAAGGKIYYAFDTVSSKTTYQQVYDATEGSPVKSFDNLLFLGKDDLKLRYDDSANARFGATLVYLANGESQRLETVIEATPELLADYNKFWFELLPPHVGQLKNPELIVLKPGFESANEALALLKEDKVSGGKVVFRG